MAGRQFNSSLESQMARLHDHMAARDKRRHQQQEVRQSTTEDIYDDRASKQRKVGGELGHASAAARAAVASASALGGPQMLHCDLCSVSFPKESQMQQHLAGPTHRKALERQRDEQRRLEQLGNNRWAAENAVGSAGWQQADRYTATQRQPTSAAAGSGSPPPFATSQLTAAAGANGRRLPAPQRPTPAAAPTATALAAEKARQSHAALVAAAQTVDGPLSIGGWVPPAISVPAPTAQQPGNGTSMDARPSSAAEEDVEEVQERSASEAEEQQPGANSDSGSESEDSDSGSSDVGGGGGGDGETVMSFF